uniref:Uncharacterized protein n=1 Tax=Anguilla anguilla TaxID=7936 RepID=A0A0E9V5L7_ANGAN
MFLPELWPPATQRSI